MKNIPSRKKGEIYIGATKPVFKGALFEVQQAEVRLPSGHKGTFELVSRQPSVTVMAIDKEERLLLNREYRPKFKKRLWRFPGGSVEKGESARVAAQRELQEEAGFKARRLKLFHQVRNGQTLEWNRSVFLAEDLVLSKLKEDEGEDIAIDFLTFEEVLSLIEKDEIQHDLTEFLIYKFLHRRKIK